MRGVIYARYSSDNQREESIEGQLRENTAYAKKNGIEIVGTYNVPAQNGTPAIARRSAKIGSRIG